MSTENKSPEEQAELELRQERENSLQEGDKVYFFSQKSPMTLKARSERYAILTEPFYRQKTVYYSIIDFSEQWKAPNNLLFNHYNYEDTNSIRECLHDLMTEKIELSIRRGCKLDIDWERTLARKAKISKKNNGRRVWEVAPIEPDTSKYY